MKTFETDRLRARELSDQDHVGFCALKADPQVTEKYFAQPLTNGQGLQKLQSLIEGNRLGSSYTYSVFLKGTEEFIGTVVLWNLQPDIGAGEIGYEFLPGYWGRGYAREILPAFIHHMYALYGYSVFSACPAVSNIASNKVLLASGFVSERSFEDRGGMLNDYLYTIPGDLSAGGRMKDFEITDKVEERDVEAIVRRLREYNLARFEDKSPQDIGVFLNDDSGVRIAGLIGHTHGNWLFVKYLWVSEQLRGQRVGSRMLRQAEDVARERGCKYAFLDTFSFQAPEFYRKQGYQEVFALEEFPRTGKRHYFTKTL